MNSIHLIGSQRGKKETFDFLFELDVSYIVWSVCFSTWKNSGFAVPFTVFYIMSSAK